jgi:hypothetical protein
MSRTPQLALIALAVFLALPSRSVVTAGAQQLCRAPAPPPSKSVNIFSMAQESDLGDAIAERYESALRVIDDETLTAHLRTIGDRLVSHLPNTDFKIQFQLADIPDANAFVLPGGRVYVTRKLVAFTRSEDELAGVLGHELGHFIARQQTIEISRWLKEILGVAEVGDRADILAKYNRLMDNAGRKPGVFAGAAREDRDQIEADRIGLFVVAAAGYDPKAHVALFDRISETQGKTGSFLSRVLGTTNPDAKRLGELIKTAAQIPANCAEPEPPGRARAYQDWQAAVAGFSGLGRRESLPGLVSQRTLAPFRSELTHLRFSPDGRFILAQDDGGITVLSRDPLAVLFHIDSRTAGPARFTPDSIDVVFNTDDLRVERWNIAARKLASVRDIYRREACIATALSPDAGTIACVDTTFELVLIDVPTGQSIFQKKGFQAIDPMALLAQLFGGTIIPRSNPPITLKFSPDGRYFAGGARSFNDTTVAFDIPARKVVALKSSARRLLAASFDFVSADRLVGLNVDEPSKSGVVNLATGEVIEQFQLPLGALQAPARGNVLFVRPFQKYAAGVFDLATKAVVKGNMTEAMDVYGDVFVAERGSGDLGLYALEGNQLRAEARLPATQLARVRTAAVSPDFQWAALSQRTRGVVWNVATGDRVTLIRDFDGAFFDETGALFADLPKAGADPRAIMRLEPAARLLSNAGVVGEPFASQYGQWLLVMRMLPPNTLAPTGLEIEFRDVRKPAAVWKKPYPKNPPDDVWPDPDSDALVVSWAAASPAGREVIRLDPELRARVKLGDIQGDHILEVLDAKSGTLRRRMLLETGKGSFHIHDIMTSGDWMFVTDSLDRVLAYSLASGELNGYAFGEEPVAAAGTGLFAVESGAGRIVVYDLKTMRRQSELTFSHDIAHKAFSPDGTRLFVLTTDQRAHVVSVK